MKLIRLKDRAFLVYEKDDTKIFKNVNWKDEEPNVFKMIAGFILMAILMLASYMAYALIL